MTSFCWYGCVAKQDINVPSTRALDKLQGRFQGRHREKKRCQYEIGVTWLLRDDCCVSNMSYSFRQRKQVRRYAENLTRESKWIIKLTAVWNRAWQITVWVCMNVLRSKLARDFRSWLRVHIVYMLIIGNSIFTRLPYENHKIIRGLSYFGQKSVIKDKSYFILCISKISTRMYNLLMTWFALLCVLV